MPKNIKLDVKLCKHSNSGTISKYDRHINVYIDWVLEKNIGNFTIWQKNYR